MLKTINEVANFVDGRELIYSMLLMVNVPGFFIQTLLKIVLI